MYSYAIATDNDNLAKELRLELKKWEKSYAAAHQGRKVGREDIKQYPEIAHKYQQYERLRRSILKRPPPHNVTPSKKRSITDSYPVPSSHSPYKRLKHAHSDDLAATSTYDTCSPRHLSPKTFRTSIGPTPQKDGQVLGLFDQHSTASKREALHPVEGNILDTPSKRPRSKDRTNEEKMYQRSLNGSKSKDLFTPSGRHTADCSTPASRSAVSKLCFDDTPAFLRRDSQHADVGRKNVFIDEEEIPRSPIAVQKLPKAAGRGLSALVRGLREMEDERLDEELKMLREMESESAPRKHLNHPIFLENDSPNPDMPLGPDGGLENDETGVDYADYGKREDDKPLKVWKKKGQKRTTRRVLMKPNTAKWKSEPAWSAGQAKEVVNGVAETQVPGADRPTDCGCDNDENEDTDRNQEITGHEKVLPKKAKKKISATAHANFRTLNIKNKQSKARQGGRFGRKR